MRSNRPTRTSGKSRKPELTRAFSKPLLRWAVSANDGMFIRYLYLSVNHLWPLHHLTCWELAYAKVIMVRGPVETVWWRRLQSRNCIAGLNISDQPSGPYILFSAASKGYARHGRLRSSTVIPPLISNLYVTARILWSKRIIPGRRLRLLRAAGRADESARLPARILQCPEPDIK